MTHPIFERNGTTPPRRPTLADFGGREFESVLRYLPNDRRRVPLNGYLQLAMAIDRACRSLPLLSVDFRTNVSGQPGIVLNVNSVVDGLTASTVVVARASSGSYKLRWPAGSLPTSNHTPEGRQVSGVYRSVTCRVYQTANECLVLCYDRDGGFSDNTDYVYNVSVWGE